MHSSQKREGEKNASERQFFLSFYLLCIVPEGIYFKKKFLNHLLNGTDVVTWTGDEIVLLDRLHSDFGCDFAKLCQAGECVAHNGLAVDLEETAEVLPRVGTPEAVSSEHNVGSGHGSTDAVGERLLVVGHGHCEGRAVLPHLCHMRFATGLTRVETVVAQCVVHVVVELSVADVGGVWCGMVWY